ncbi:MAG TPA: thioredoxin family protein [Gemmatimonadales bacterium]|nr:thioredoxin family protein [Gemmatimonadales bacterium]
MLLSPLLALALAAAPVSCDGGAAVSATARTPVPALDTLAALYDAGVEWAAFLEGVRARRQTWQNNYAAASVDASIVERLERVLGRWRFLVVAVDACGDSAHTIPYLARLVEASDRLELRVVSPVDGAWVMESHRTADGRAATPTVVLLDDLGAERGCWVERPYALRQVLEEQRAGTIPGSFIEVITAWRREDQGRSTFEDMTALLEAAAAGTVRCP